MTCHYIWVDCWYFLCYECTKVGHFWLVLDQISTCWLAKSTVQHKTQQNKTHNNQHEIPPPYPPAALPSPSMGRPVVPPTHGTEATKVPKQGIWSWVCAWGGWFPCSGCHTDTPWKSERQEGSWPYSQNLIKTHNNQLEINDSSKRDVGERARGGWSMWGDGIPLFGWLLGQQKNNINESRQGLRQPPIDEDTHKPTRNRWTSRRWYRRGGSTGGDCLGDVMPSFWGQ